jgi:hypothetical protein
MIKELILKHSGNDKEKFFYVNRFIYSRLQRQETKEKNAIKNRMFKPGCICLACEGELRRNGAVLHRIDSNRSYSDDNCVLMHKSCHESYHAEKSRKTKIFIYKNGRTVKILMKSSKRYEDRNYLYWWDITPNQFKVMRDYEKIEFIKGNNQESCIISTKALLNILTSNRQTTRAKGNWGIKVLRKREDALAFEPGRTEKEWYFLRVTWKIPDKLSSRT